MNSTQYVAEFKEEKYSPYSQYVLAFGQLPGGTAYPTAGSGPFWFDAPGTNGSLNFSVGFSVGNVASFSVGIQPGTIKGSGTGEHVAITEEHVNKEIFVYTSRRYVVKRYAIYSYELYSGPDTKLFVGYQDTVSPYSKKLEIRLA